MDGKATELSRIPKLHWLHFFNLSCNHLGDSVVNSRGTKIEITLRAAYLHT